MDREAASAFQFLRDQGASKRLLQHVTLVHDTAAQLIHALRELGVSLDADQVLVGAVLHDAGKMAAPDELHTAGAQHEGAGRELLLRAGYAPVIARFCVSHGRWQEQDCSLEELIVALADKLWKGKREDALETMVVERLAEALNRERWELFQNLDGQFEAIAEQGHQRVLLTRETAE